jgi:formin 2/WAS/WASL-interacting protein
MGFLDKAKKLAEQAQTKLDEVQAQINQQGSSQAPPQGPVTEYDKHGRPIPPQQTATPPHGDPLSAPGSVPPPPAPGGPTPDPGAPGSWSAPQPPTPPAPPAPPSPPAAETPGVPATGAPAPVEGHGQATPPAMPGVPPAGEDRNHPSYAPPKLTSGDPLAG